MADAWKGQTMNDFNAQGKAGLRQRKKTLTRETIEQVALQLFVSRGYDNVRLEDICEAAMVSLRTFFRYFTSKEDVVIGRLRAHLALAEQLFARRPESELLSESLRVVIEATCFDYLAQPEQELTRMRLVRSTPTLSTGLLDVFAGFERLVCGYAAKRRGADSSAPEPRLLAAAVVSAFRIGLEMWVEADGQPDLSELVNANCALLGADLADRSWPVI
jgi:TetR/AcrR family transcriptional regulator, regulator of mycofactocin system